MKPFDYSITVFAPSGSLATEKVEALMVLASHLSARELKALEKVISSDPKVVKAAKSFLGLS